MTTKTIYGSVHKGGALRHLVEQYPSLLAVLKELIQNSIDVDFGGASKIVAEINFDNGKISYFDNGAGISPETFQAAVNSLAHSIKKKDKYGRFGIGLVSPLSIAKLFHFVTAPQGSLYHDYEFDRERLFAVGNENYPIAVREDRCILHGDNRTPGVRSPRADIVWWRTAIYMSGLTDDKQKRKLDIDTLQADVQSAYGKKLVDLGTKITIKVTEGGKTTEQMFKAKLYEGRKLPEWSKTFADIGKVTVNFHLTPAGFGGKQRIDIGGGDNPSRVPITKLFLSTFYECMDDKTKAALKSTIFQGEIVGEHLELLASRKGFAQNDAFFALSVALDQWYEDVGRVHFEDEKRLRKNNRYQEISREVIDRLKPFTLGQDSPFASLFDQALYGSVGKGHATMSGTEIPDIRMKGKVPGGNKLGDEKGSNSESSRERKEPKDAKPHHHPGVAIGPSGGERKVVKGHSAGLHIVMDIDLGKRMWRFNPEALCLEVSDSHPGFIAVEKSDRQLREYVMMIAMSALRLELIADERVREAAQDFAQTHIEDLVKMMYS